jgi:carbon monoxide dehydrogenase subunit G
MELTGDMQIAAPRDKVWDALNDPDILARCIPGCEAIEVVSPIEKTARVMVKVGPVRTRFNGRIRMGDVRPGEGCTMQFEGSGGAAGMAKGQSEVELADHDGGTRLRYNVKASVGGKLGQVGGRMIDAAARQMADQFFAAFNKQLGDVPAAAASAPVTAPPATGEGQPVLPSMQPGGAATSLAVPVVSAPTLASASLASSERVRVLWFVLGSLATGFGVWIGSLVTA